MLKKWTQHPLALPVQLAIGAALFVAVISPVLSSAKSVPLATTSRVQSFEDRWEAMRQDRQAKMQEMRDALAEHLKTLQDQTKASIATRLTEQLNVINMRVTNNALTFLTRLETILGKITSRTDIVGQNKDVATVRVKINSATSAIANAKTATMTQQAKIYTVTIPSEAKLRETFVVAKKKLIADLEALRKTIQQAKSAVQAAFDALVKIAGESASNNE